MDINPQQWLSMPKTERQRWTQKLIAGQRDFDFINLVSAGRLGVYASLGVHFDYAIFGRDSLQVAEDVVSTHRSLAMKIIHTLAGLQGVKTDSKSEEEPGKIHHEYRSRVFDGQSVPEISLNIMRRLQRAWGDETSDTIRYYGSYDATPQYIRLVGAFTKRYGPDFLDDIYESLDGQKRIYDSVRAAALWLVNKIESSPWLLFEYKRLNVEAGIANQCWKDSATSYLHTNGEIANTNDGIASAEMQGLAYDALMTASEIVAKDEAEKNDWKQLAQQLQEQTIKQLWMPESKFFAQGLDRSAKGQTRRIETITSNGAAILDSRLIEDLPDLKRQPFVEGVAAMIASIDFMTPVGTRSRAMRHKNMPGFVDYHGSYTVWPKETYTIARGLRRVGHDKLADQLESRILDGVMRAGEFYEFFYVNDTDRVWYDRDEAIEHFRSIGLGVNIAIPETGQAWTISAVLAILDRLRS